MTGKTYLTLNSSGQLIQLQGIVATTDIKYSGKCYISHMQVMCVLIMHTYIRMYSKTCLKDHLHVKTTCP